MSYRQLPHTTPLCTRPAPPPEGNPYSTSQATIARTYPSRHTRQQQIGQTPQPTNQSVLIQPANTHLGKKKRPSQARAHRPGKVWLASGSMAFLAALAIVPAKFKPTLGTSTQVVCQTAVRSEAQLSREQLSRFLSVPTHSSKTAVQGMLQTPYCILNATSDSTGEALSREAYPLAFDPDTWFIVLYAGEDYTGYDFVFRR